MGKESVVEACRASLSRLQVSSVELYQLHWPGLWQNDDYLDGLAELVNQGLVKSVGVSNYNEKRLRKAHARHRAAEGHGCQKGHGMTQTEPI